MLKISKDVEKAIGQVDMAVLSLTTFRTLGVAILRRAISGATMAAWQRAWQRFKNDHIAISRAVNPFNPVVLNEALPNELAVIYRHREILDIMEQIYPDLGIFGQRFVIKDKHASGPVFFHQDYGYDLGWPEKTSVFLPLSPMTPANGGLAFLPGTHHFGYLGDAGEIDTDTLAPGWPILRPELEPGDIVLMHECTWHGSGPQLSGPDRIVVQLQYQPASDPSSLELLRGNSDDHCKLTESQRHLIFRRSRSTRLRELQAEVNRLVTADKD